MKKCRANKAIGRKRRVAGWMLLILGLLVAAVCVRSVWYGAAGESGAYRFSVVHGVAVVQHFEGAGWKPSVYWSRWASGYLRFTTDPVGADSGVNLGVVTVVTITGAGGWRTNWFVQTTLWVWPLVLLVGSGLLTRSGAVARRRALGNKCKSCGYDLAGLAAGAQCPECGKTVD